MPPQDGLPLAGTTIIEAALASNFKPDVIEKKCFVPSVIDRVLVERCASLPGSEVKSKSVAAHLPDPVVMSPVSGPAQVRGVETPASPAQEAQPEAQSQSAPATATAENTLRVDSERIDDVLNLVGELILGKSMLQQTMVEFDKRFTKDPLRSKFGDAL